ncbi:MAG TPA: SCO family protein [Polyangiaceae bacterium]|jgi:protein SCO1/2|nr:SCO family protein [Polyangiaceae bacterium]
MTHDDPPTTLPKREPPTNRHARATGRRSASWWTAFILWGALFATGCHKDTALPVLADVPKFAMTDQSGKAFTNDTLRGKVWAAAFVFTRCPSACPRVTKSMRGVQKDAAARGVALHLVSFSIDPDNDTPEVLRAYATEYQADTKTWSFVTGDADGVRKVAEQGFKIAVDGTADPQKPSFGIAHGTELVLVDQNEKIRGFYASADPQALTSLIDDAARLDDAG